MVNGKFGQILPLLTLKVGGDNEVLTTTKVAVVTHPKALVPLTEYTVVILGETKGVPDEYVYERAPPGAMV
jgi:hypothetical protein